MHFQIFSFWHIASLIQKTPYFHLKTYLRISEKMIEQSLTSLFGLPVRGSTQTGALSSKEPLASGIPKTNGNSIQTNHEENGFHARLINSMKDSSTHDTQTDLSSSSDINNTKGNNQIIEMVSLGLSNSIDVDQNITIEAITHFIANNSTNGNTAPTQTPTGILSDIALSIQESETQQSESLIEPSSNLLKVIKGATSSVSDKANSNQSNLPENSTLAKLTGPMLQSSAVTGQTSSSTKIQTNILSDNVLPIQDSKAQQSKSLIGPSSNLLKVIKGATIPVSDKANSNQSNLDGKSSLNKITDTINNTSTVTGQTSASTQKQTNTFSDNVLLIQDSKAQEPETQQSKSLIEPNSNQNNSIINNEQNIFETSNKSNPDKVAVEETGPLQRISRTNTINKLLETNSNPGNDSSRLNIERESSNPALQTSRDLNRHNLISNAMFEAKDNAANNNTSNHNTLLNPEENVKGKIDENLKEQHPDKISPANTGTKLPSPQGLAKIDPDNNESSIIFNTSSNSVEANFAKSSDNTAIIQNNGVITGDITSSANTSSDNSSSNNQSSDILSEFGINSVNTRKNTVPETNFTDTLSQINNSSKPLGTLGNDVADNIIQSAKLYMDGGKSEIKMQLSPPELGTLKLEFTVDDDILDAKITVERSAVKEIIEKDIPRLRELISGSDIDVGKLDVSLQENENNRFGFKDKNPQPSAEKGSTEDQSNLENEEFEKETDEESIADNTDSKQINYLL